MALTVVVTPGPEFDRVARALGRADVQMDNRMQSALRRAAQPVMEHAKAAALRLPARTGQHTGVRRRLAAGVGIRTAPQGYRFTTSMDEEDEAYLPRGFDDGQKGWRHPFFGNMDIWYHQDGASWFRETIANDRMLMERVLTDELEDIAEQIGDAGRGP